MNLFDLGERLSIPERQHEAHRSLFLMLINLMLACDEGHRARVAKGIQNILLHPDVLGDQDSALLRQILRTVRAGLVREPDAALQAYLSEPQLRPVM